jgi:hypothetical protein
VEVEPGGEAAGYGVGLAVGCDGAVGVVVGVGVDVDVDVDVELVNGCDGLAAGAVEFVEGCDVADAPVALDEGVGLLCVWFELVSYGDPVQPYAAGEAPLGT